MGAAIGKLGMTLLGGAGLIPRPGADTAVVAVRAGRFLYIGSLVYIGGLWYFAWRNQRADGGEYPIPGLDKRPVKRPNGAPDVDEPDDVQLPYDATPGTITNPLQPPTQNFAPTKAPTALSGNAALLEGLGRLAPSFGVRATEHPKFGGVNAGHSPTGFHPKGRAIDFVAPMTREGIAAMATFAKYLDDNYRNRISELIWAGTNPKSVKNGASVPSTFWGADTWQGHKNHVHLAI